MKKLLIGTGLVVVLGVVGLVALPSLIPSSVYKEKIEAQLEKELARNVTVSGDVKLSVFPVIKANAGRVEIDNPDGFSTQQFASMDGMSARVKLWPLLSKRVEIASFTLKNPQINLEKTASGATNWSFGEDKPTSDVSDDGPFKRDGRFSDIETSIGNFTLENGSISYVDKTQDTNHDLNDVNVSFSIPSLADPIKIDGALTYNDLPAEVDLELDSPRAFLNGQAAPIDLKFKTEFAELNAKGQFLPGEDIAFNLDMSGDVSDVAKLVTLLPEPIEHADLISSVNFDGNYNFDGKTLSAKGADIRATGTNLDARFDGDATLAEKPILSGNLSLDAGDIQSLAKRFDQDIQGLALLESANVKASFSAEGDGFVANDIKADLKGEHITANYTGTAKFQNDAPSADGRFTVDIPSVAKANEIAGLDIKQASALGNLKASGNIGYANEIVTIRDLDARTEGDIISGNYKGAFTLNETPALDGQFSVDIPSVARANEVAGLDIKQASALGNLKASGNIGYANEIVTIQGLDARTEGDIISGNYSGAFTLNETPALDGQFSVDIPSVARANEVAGLNIDAANGVGNLEASGGIKLANKIINLTGLTANTSGDLVSGQYNGSATIGETPSYNGNFTANVTSLATFSERTKIDIPHANAIGKINLSGSVSGAGETINLSSLDARLTEGQINGRYTGSAAMKSGLELAGNLEADIPSLRALAATTGNNNLPPSTAIGQIYERFAVNGQVSGTPQAIAFTSANLSFDQIKGNGNFNVDLSGAKPFINGTMDMGELDLRPYMAAMSAQNPTGEIQPWSEAPINTDPFKSLNGSFTINSQSIITDRLSLGPSNISAKLNNGVLKADIPNLLMYGGAGRLNVNFDTASAVPTLNMDMSFDRLNTNSFLSAIAGFTMASGESGTGFTLAGRGRSQAEIMRSLSGRGGFKMKNGEISGVDLTELLTGIDQALTSRQLPGGIGRGHVTKFRDIVGKVNIRNGVASIDQFSLSGFGVLAEGAGQIDLGNQTIDFSLRPRLTGESASNIGAFGIPLRATGGFGNVSAGLDTNFIGKIAAEKAKAEAASLVQDQVGGALGGVLGGVLGGGTSQTTPAPQQPSTSTQPASRPQSTEETVTNIFGGILGSQSNTQTQEPQKEEEAKKEEEPKLEDAILGSIFGKKDK